MDIIEDLLFISDEGRVRVNTALLKDVRSGAGDEYDTGEIQGVREAIAVEYHRYRRDNPAIFVAGWAVILAMFFGYATRHAQDNILFGWIAEFAHSISGLAVAAWRAYWSWGGF